MTGLLLWLEIAGRTEQPPRRRASTHLRHRCTDRQGQDDGSRAVTKPWWTTRETPSDLSVGCATTPTGVVVIEDLPLLVVAGLLSGWWWGRGVRSWWTARELVEAPGCSDEVIDQLVHQHLWFVTS
jgi:hypothetical protein